jgi:transcriptional regulator with XRE-family HTH domain
MGTSQSHIARIELGRNDPGYDTFHRLAIALEADVGEVVKAFGRGRDLAEAEDFVE